MPIRKNYAPSPTELGLSSNPIAIKDITERRLNGESLRSIGKRWNVSGERIRQLCDKWDVSALLFTHVKKSRAGSP